MKQFVILGYIFIALLFLIYSYGFVDKNLVLSTHPIYQTIHAPLQYFVFEKRGWAGMMYVVFLLSLWGFYGVTLHLVHHQRLTFFEIKKIIVIVSAIFLFSFPAFSYDIFNYILTSKVVYTYTENPWLVRPIEIPNEPNLAFTRAANKTALYGPTWIALTVIPHLVSMNHVWVAIIAFKGFVAAFFFFFLYIVWRVTKSVWNVTAFALNPLVLITVLNEGHNDMVMMTFAVLALLIPRFKFALWCLSVLVKGATILLVFSRSFAQAYWFMFVIFMISPFREEMYPWYFVWCLSFLVLLPYTSHRLLYMFSFSLCFGLLLRNLPYIVTRQYEGYNQIIRTAVTWLPLVMLMSLILWRRYIVTKKKR